MPGAAARPAGAVAGAAQQQRQVGDHGRVRCRGADHRQVGRHPLVALDELVALATVEPPLLGQRREPLPLRVVREHDTRPDPRAPDLCCEPMSSPEFAMLSADDLVTGEAVALDLPAASVGARIAVGAHRRRRARGAWRFGSPLRGAGREQPRRRRAPARRRGLLADGGVPGLPDGDGDADPRQVSGQARGRAPRGPRRRRHGHRPAGVRPRPGRGRRRSTPSAVVRRSSAAWSARAASVWATTPPAPTSSATGCRSGSRRPSRCRPPWPSGRPAPTCERHRSGSPWRRASTSRRLADSRPRVATADRRPARHPDVGVRRSPAAAGHHARGTSWPRSAPPGASATSPGSTATRP